MKQSELQAGNPYFILLYDDKDLTVLVIQTIVYLKKDVTENGEPVFLFNKIETENNIEKMFVYESNFESLVLDQLELISKLSE